MNNRTHVVVNVGNLLELLGATATVYGVARLAGFAYGLMLLGVLLVAAAELIYDTHVWRLPVPHRPHPFTAARRLQTRVARWQWDRQIRRLLREGERREEPVVSPDVQR